MPLFWSFFPGGGGFQELALASVPPWGVACQVHVLDTSSPWGGGGGEGGGIDPSPPGGGGGVKVSTLYPPPPWGVACSVSALPLPLRMGAAVLFSLSVTPLL